MTARTSGDRHPESLLEVRDVSIHFGGLNALSDVTLTVDAGSIVGLVGPNGSGKTTLVNVISGVYNPSAGEVYFDGDRIDGMFPEKIAARGLVRTFQQASVFPDSTVRENIAIGSFLRSGGDDSTDGWIEEVLARVGLSERAENVARELGLGEQKHLGIGIAIASEPKMLLLDEPAAGMSIADVEGLMELIVRLRREGQTILVIEHNMDLVMDVCDRVVVLNFGDVLADGEPGEIAGDERVAAAYLGRRRVNAPGR